MSTEHSPPVEAVRGGEVAGDVEACDSLEVPLLSESGEGQMCTSHGKQHWLQTTVTLLALQLGWGLWLMPYDFARLGWIPGVAVVVGFALLTMYSGNLFCRLHQHVPGAVLFGDIGDAAYGSWGRSACYWITYTLDATRCIVMHLAATKCAQYALLREDVPLWQYAGAVCLMMLVVGQVKCLEKMCKWLMVGTFCQFAAIIVVLVRLIVRPSWDHPTELVHRGELQDSLVAVMNVVFAYGGQFAFVEIINGMKVPSQFSQAIALCTPIMTFAYLGLAAVGYYNQGTGAAEILAFNMGHDVVMRLAILMLLIQALAQYLVNLNVWTHNILVLLSRSPLFEGRSNKVVRTAADHDSLPWFLATVFVVGYSGVVTVALPFLSALIGVLSAMTYLLCAYTLPALFVLKLFGDKVSRLEKGVLYLIIPASIALSALGLYASLLELMQGVTGEL